MKRVKNNGPRIHRLFNGDYVKVSGVSPALIDQVQASVKDPVVPRVTLDDGSVVENPVDPEYIRAKEEAQSMRQLRSLHAIILFGFELVDEDGNPIDEPQGSEWERRLRRVGIDWRKEILEVMNAEEFIDEEDEKLARKDAYMLFVAFTGHRHDLALVNEISGMDQLAQAQAEEQFQS